jgi:hypothetical protein
MIREERVDVSRGTSALWALADRLATSASAGRAVHAWSSLAREGTRTVGGGGGAVIVCFTTGLPR